MKRTMCLLAMLCLWAFPRIQAQTSELLPPQVLERQKWYTSMEEALAEPDKVYKLTLADQKLESLPAEIGQLTNLQMLNLSNNKLKALPPEIGALKNLQFLSVYKNRIVSLPLEMRSLSHIEVLYLGRNRLAEVPLWIGGLGHLRRMDLTVNRVSPLEVHKIQALLPKAEITY